MLSHIFLHALILSDILIISVSTSPNSISTLSKLVTLDSLVVRSRWLFMVQSGHEREVLGLAEAGDPRRDEVSLLGEEDMDVSGLKITPHLL